MDWETDVQTYLAIFLNGCPEELRPGLCPECGAEGKMHRHGKFSRKAITFIEAVIIPIYRFKCYACKGCTVSLIPSFLGAHQQAIWDAQEEIIRQNENGNSLEKVAERWKPSFVAFSVKTLWRWKKQWDQQLQEQESRIWAQLIDLIPHVTLPVGSQKPQRRWLWLFSLWEQFNSRHPQSFGLLHWLYRFCQSGPS